MNKRTYVVRLMPGILFPEESVSEVSERDPQKVADEAPRNVFGFYFYDIAETEQDGITMRSGQLDKSPYYYIDATKFSLKEIESIHGHDSIIASNMRGNGWDNVARCRTGNFRPLDEKDVIVHSGDNR